MNTHPFKKSIAVLLLVAILAPLVVLLPPRPVQAVPTFDTSTLPLITKEYLLDLLARILAAGLIRNLNRQVVGWIQGNGGANVGFVDSLTGAVQQEINAETGEFVNRLTGINLCGNIRPFLRLTFGAPRRRLQRDLRCTVTDIIDNVEDYFDDFSKGGWPAFAHFTFRAQNTPQGAFLIALQEQTIAQNEQRRRIEQEYSAGSGFLGSKSKEEVCTPIDPTRQIELDKLAQALRDEGFAEETVAQEIETRYGTTFDVQSGGWATCKTETRTRTPGKLVSDSLSKAFGSGYDFAIVGDEFNELIASVINAMINRTLSASIGRGKGILSRSIRDTPEVRTGRQSEQFQAVQRFTEQAQLAERTLDTVENRIDRWESELAACTANPSSGCNPDQLRRNISEYRRLKEELLSIRDTLESARDKLSLEKEKTLSQNEAIKAVAAMARLRSIIQIVGGPTDFDISRESPTVDTGRPGPSEEGTGIGESLEEEGVDPVLVSQTIAQVGQETARADAALMRLEQDEDVAISAILALATTEADRATQRNRLDAIMVAKQGILGVKSKLLARFRVLSGAPFPEEIESIQTELVNFHDFISQYLRDGGMDPGAVVVSVSFDSATPRSTILAEHVAQAIALATRLNNRIDMVQSRVSDAQRNAHPTALSTLTSIKALGGGDITNLTDDQARLVGDQTRIAKLTEILNDIQSAGEHATDADSLIKAILAP